MKAVSLSFFLSFFFFTSFLSGQMSCDTAKINAALAHAAELLDGRQIQTAIDAAQPTLNDLAACPDADVAFRGEVFRQVAECYHTAAGEYLYRGMINQSIDMSERCIALYRQMPDNNADLLADAYMELANANALNDNRKIAIEQAVTGLRIRQIAYPASPKIIRHYDQIVGNYLALDDTKGARIYLEEWEALHRRLGSKAPMQARINLANNWALYYYAENNLNKAIRVLEDTLALYGEALRAKGGLVGVSEFSLCEYYTIVGNYEKSLYYAEKNVALFELRLKQQRGKLFGRSHFAWCLAQSARAAWGLYRQTRDTSWYNLAERRSAQAEEMIFAMRDRSPNDGFRDWMGDDMDIVANLAEVRQGMYAESGDKSKVERAFEAIEASKTFAMQRFLHETYALRWGGLPDSIYQEETIYREKINDLETNFFMVRMQPDADSLIAANDQELFTLRDRYSIFLANLEKNYPEYFRLKYGHPAVDLLQVQKQSLRPGQCMLDLYIRNDFVFALLVRPDTMIWLATPYDSLTHAAIETLESESRHFTEYQNLPEKEYLARLQAYADASHRVYQVLIEPVRPMLLEEILLIPRNELAVLPFGALLTQKETNMGKPFGWHFLDNEFVISQAFSVGLFQFVQNRPVPEKPSGTVLALAPFFEGKVSEKLQLPVSDVATATRGEIFNILPNSGAEAEAVARLTGGEVLEGANATKANFLRKSPDFKILHLATHSIANDVLGEYSFVALQAENASQKVDLLYARDIYGLRLSADLVVLSACETALGQYRNGEGIIGLTRAFTCAGVRNVVASLWSVDDASTKSLMVLFYREIKKGTPYNRALANAKRTFIRENRQYAHPYYWAGFVLNGR